MACCYTILCKRCDFFFFNFYTDQKGTHFIFKYYLMANSTEQYDLFCAHANRLVGKYNRLIRTTMNIHVA